LETAVVASPHEIRGYAVKAFVILIAGETPTNTLAEELFTTVKNISQLQNSKDHRVC